MSTGIILAIILGFGLGLLLAVSRKPKTSQKSRAKNEKSEFLNKKVVQEKWQQIEQTAALAGPSNYKTAIMDADKLVDSVLKSSVKGENMGERLKNAKSKFRNYSDYDNLWFAHKVRNNIAHEVNHEINSAEAKRAIEYYKKALKVLGAI